MPPQSPGETIVALLPLSAVATACAVLFDDYFGGRIL
jgi:hypothetical protein